ncbi:hypothetical protein ACTNDP_16220 [Paenibacillus barengoltzii]|uniref:hypothetical protein n=1 Tax=Paenibacillus barengoltzii TaxID=343517 RepID=UPI003F8BE5EB
MSSNKTGVITYTGIQDLENAISGDSVAMAFRLPTTVTSLTKSKNKSGSSQFNMTICRQSLQ